MKKFICSVIAFLLLLFVCDYALGYAFRYLVAHAKGGDTGLNNSINDKIEDDVLIFGSSRAMHHYDPIMIEDSLGLSCFNCARDGNGIILMYGRYKMISQRYTPKMIIYEITAGFDLMANDNHTYLPNLRYYYDRPSIDSIFWSVDKNERYKMLSNCYRYNMNPLQLVMDNIHPMQSDTKGFRAIHNTMAYEPKVTSDVDKTYEYDDLKLYYLRRLLEDCEGKTKVVFCASPLYKNVSDKVYEPIKKLAAEYGAPFLNHYCDSTFNFKKEYFSDTSHMNREGATAYTNVIIGEIREMLKR